MGRLLLILLIIVAVVLVWKAFGPGSWKRNRPTGGAEKPRAVKGPDDDEEFLWNIEKNRFKERRAREAAAREEEERMKKTRKRYETPEEEPDA